MADYYRILSTAIENQELSGEADRQALYARARTALEAQFASMDEDLVADLIKSHQQNFDDAVAKIEQEIQVANAEAASDVEPASSTSATPSVDNSVEATTETPPQPAIPSVIPEQKTSSVVETKSSETANEVETGTQNAEGTPELKSDAKTETAVSPPSKGISSDEKSGSDAPVSSGPSVQKPVTPPTTGAPTLSTGGPSAYVAPSTRTEPTLKSTPELAATARQPTGGNPTPEPKKRGVGAIVFATLFLLIASVSAFALWKQDIARDYSNRLGVMTGLWGETETPVLVQGNVPETESQTTQQTEASNDTATTPSPDVMTEAPASQTPASPTSPEPDTGRVGDSAPAENVSPTEQVAANDTATETSPEEPSPTSETPSQNAEATVSATDQNSQQPTSNPIELPLRAFFLIEKSTGGADPDDRYSGGAIWEFDEATKTLRIDTIFPRRNTELSIDINANTDSSFPASHTVTYTHKSGGEKPDGSIINFPALMVRADAGSEGEPLKGAGALIVPDKYILGLSEDPENVSYNLNLVDKAQWLVVPVVFESENRRALFVVEKGPQGARAFSSALAAWGQSNLIVESQ